jgi:hypothetical protein
MATELIMRMPLDPRSADRIKGFKESIKDIPLNSSGGRDLPGLSTLPEFEGWLNSPVTLQLLARVENKREELRDSLDKMQPCASCKKDGDGVDKEYRSWLAGAAEFLDAIARTILSGQQPACEHDAPDRIGVDGQPRITISLTAGEVAALAEAATQAV